MVLDSSPCGLNVVADKVESESRPPAVGAPAPQFPALTARSGQPVVIAFFPRGWDPARDEQIAQYNAILSAVPGQPTRMVGLSVEDGAVMMVHGGESVSVALLSNFDQDDSLARRYGVSGRQALFLIDESGIVRWQYVAAVGESPNPDRLMHGLAALSPETPAEEGPGNKRGKYPNPPLTRREFVAAAVAAALALALPIAVRAQVTEHPAVLPAAPAVAPAIPTAAWPVALRVNGADHSLILDPRVTLLDALREYAGLTGSKKGCDHGQCGACTVHVDGRRVLSCLTLAAAAVGHEITTIEGLASGETLHPMQQSFIAHDGFQCGYCTPGQIMSAVALLKEAVGPSDDDVREWMSGNICRCGAYPNIVSAIQEVRKGPSGVPV